MKKYLYKSKRLITTVILLSAITLNFRSVSAQALSGTYTVPGSYATIAAAITALNTNGVGSGGAIINIAAGTAETAPTGGYSLGSTTLNASLSLANQLIIQKSGAGVNPLITAYTGGTGTPGTASQDVIFKLVGADYVTINGIDLAENAANTANPATMEAGFAFYKASLSDGAQNNTIKNCNITLNRLNNASGTAPMVDGSVGIAVMNATAAAATTSLVPTTRAGTNSYNKFYSNTIQNCNIGIALIGYAASSPYTAADTLNDIGGTSLATGNQIQNFGGAASAANPSAGVRTLAQYGLNVSYNTVNNNNGLGVNHVTTLRGIYLNTATSANAAVTNNTVSVKGGGTTTNLTAIENASGSTAASNTINITDNFIQSCTYTTATTGVLTGIVNTASPATLNITGNIIDGLSFGASVTTGILNCISNSGSATTANISTNTLQNITTYPAAASGAFNGIINSGSGTNLNIYSNVIKDMVLGSTGVHVFIETGSPTNANVKFNGLTNISRTALSGSSRMIKTTTPGSAFTADSNTIDGISWTAVASTGSTDGIYGLSSATAVNIRGNVIRNLSVPLTGMINGIREFGTDGAKKIQNNQIYNFFTTAGGAGGATFNGIFCSVGSIEISGNQIYSMNSTGTTGGTAGTVYGIQISGGSSPLNIFKNRIYDISSTSTGPVVSGILISTTVAVNNIYNNLIGDLRATAANVADVVKGINITAGTSGTISNVYYNTIYINATSTGANFGTTGLFHTANATATVSALNLRNNIIVNTSTANGTGKTVAYRRSGTALTNYANTSNNNLFYAGVPGAGNLIYYQGPNDSDQTMATYKARMVTRDQLSVSENPVWASTSGASANFLNISTGTASVIESGGANISTYVNDYNGNIRAGNPGYPAQVNGGGSAPDIGAWEFDGLLATPSFSATTYSPSIQCTATSHLISGTILPNIGTITSATLNYAFNGIAQPPISMSNTTGNIWEATIPAATPVTANVTWSITATNSSSLEKVFNGQSYADEPMNGALASVLVPGSLACAGLPTPITASVSKSGGFGTVGAGASTIQSDDRNPFYHLWGGMKTQYLITAAELTAGGLRAGDITSIALNVTVSTGQSFNGFAISMTGTALTAMTTAFATTLTPVYAAASVTPVVGTNTYAFTTPYTWNGTDNIIVQFCWSNNNSGSNANTPTIKYDAVTGYQPNSYYRVDNTAPATVCGQATASGATTNGRPQFILGGVGAAPSNAFTYTWSDGSSTIGTSNPLIVSPVTNTNYSFTATDVNGCSITSAPALVTVTTSSMSGSINVGSGQAYPTLTSAVNAYNDVCTLAGPVEFVLTDAAYNASTGETFPIVIKHNNQANNTNNLTIRPSVANTVITGRSNTSVITLNGADYVTIDGSMNGTNSRDLTIICDTALSTTAVIWGQSTISGDSATHNTVKNVIVKGNSNTTTLIGVGFGSNIISATSTGSNNNSNTIKNCSVGKVQYGIYSAGTSIAVKNQNTIIDSNELNTVAPDNIQLRGILVGFENNIQIKQNKVGNMSSSSSVIGISLGVTSTNTFSPSGNEVTNATVMNNKVGPVTGTGGSTAFGMAVPPVTSGTNLLVNNAVFAVQSGATPSDFCAGIYIGGGTGSATKMYFNTVSLSGSATRSTPSAYALAIGSGDPVIELKNNILYNVQTTTGAGYSYAIGYGSSAFTNLVSDYNLYYTAGANAQFAVTGGLGINTVGTVQANLATLRTATGKDANSISSNPSFASTTNLTPDLGTALLGGGIQIPGITRDIIDSLRANPPSIGAYEKAVDLTGPAITYALLGNDFNPVGSRTLTGFATITDASGVNVISGTSPRLYYKKKNDANVFIGNTAGDNGWKWVEASNAASPFDFAIDYNIIFGGAVSNTDTIYYFVTAEDNSPAVNISANPSAGFVGTTVASITSAPTTPNFYIVVNQPPMNGPYTIGVTGDFTSFSSAMAGLALRGAVGPVTLELIDATYGVGETFPITINPYSGMSSTNRLTIKPASGVSPVISASSTSSIFKINGADFVTIDGSNNGTTSRDLTIVNTSTSTTSAVVWITGASATDGAENNIVKNTIIRGNTPTTTLAAIFIGGSIGTSVSTNAAPAPNNYNLISNNLIAKAQYGVLAIGKAGNQDLVNKIMGNDIGSAAAGDTLNIAGMLLIQQNGDSISKNTVRNITGSSGISLSGDTYMAGIYLYQSRNSMVNANRVFNFSVSSGSFTRLFGICVDAAGFTTVSSPSNNSVINNLVYDGHYPGSGSTWTLSGINFHNGFGDKVYFNSVYLTGVLSTTSSGGPAAAFSNGNSAASSNSVNIDIRNNIFSIVGSASGATYGHFTTAANYTGSTVDRNDYWLSLTAGTPYIGSQNGTTQTTLAGWKTATTMESNSVNINPAFASSTNLQPGLGVVDGLGVTIAGIATDFKDTTRNNPPALGAYEYGVDLAGPVITYTAIPNTTSLANYVLTNFATATDISGVNTVSGTSPRLYFKKYADANVFGANNSSVNGWKWVEASNASSPFSFTIDYALLNSSPLVGDTISYFVAAQDLVATPNVGANPSAGFAATSVGSITTAPTTPGAFLIVDVPMSGPYTVGVSGNYPNLTAAAFATRTRGLQGDVELQVITNITEPGAVAIYPWTETGAGNYNLTIRPTGTDTVFANVANSGVIVLVGASRVTIDGRIAGGTTNELAIVNTNTATGPNGVILLASQGAGLGCSNNTIRNLNLRGNNNAAANVAGIQLQGDNNNNVIIRNNNIQRVGTGINVFATTAGTGSHTGLIVSGNTIGGATATDYVTFGGINIANASAAVIRQNTIFNIIIATSTRLYGIQTGAYTAKSVISGNKISTISNNISGGYGVYGINLSSVTSADSIDIINNVVYNLPYINYSATSLFDNPFGIRITGGVRHRILYNSVNLYGNSIAVGSSASLSAALVITSNSSTNLTVQNNIFANKYQGMAGSQAFAVYAVSGVVFTTINNNNYDTSGSGIQGRIGFLGSNATTLPAWAVLTGQDNLSRALNSAFTTDSNLTINSGSSPSAVESAGAPIAGVTTDFNGDPRPKTVPTTYGGNLAPDMGAYEVDGAMLDVDPPVISYTALTNDLSGATTRAFSADIRDDNRVTATGVNINPGSAPRIYYKKKSDANVFLPGNNSGDNGWKWVEASNTTTPFNFTFDYSKIYGGSVAHNDTIEYFVVAEDNAGTPNVASNPSVGFAATNVATITSAPTTPNRFVIVTLPPMAGVYTVGTSGSYDYPTISAAVGAVGLRGVSAAVTFSLMDGSYTASGETFPITVFEYPGASAVNSLTIKPATGVSPVISGSATSIFKLNGADYVTIDGSNTLGGTTRDLTITNTNAASNVATIWLAGLGPNAGAKGNTIKNVIISGGNNAGFFNTGIYAAGTAITNDATNISGAGENNDSLVIRNNQFKATRHGIYVGSTLANQSSGLTIKGNDLAVSATGALGRNGIIVTGVSNIEISANQIGNFGDNTASAIKMGIWIRNNTSNAKVFGNNIYNIAYSGTNGYAAQGIVIQSAVSDASVSNIDVYNNMISGLTGDGNSYSSFGAAYSPAGIYLQYAMSGVRLMFNSINLYGNTVNKTASVSIGIALDANASASLKNNIIVNTLGRLASTGTGSIGVALQQSAAQLILSDYNNMYVNATGGGTNVAGRIAATSYTTLADWQAIVAQEAHSKSMAVSFASPSDLHLIAPSLNDFNLAGVSIPGITTDYDGDARPAAFPYMGADENLANPLPVSLISFKANAIKGDVLLTWSTASETNNAGFVIERSADGKSFESVGFVKGNGSSNVTISYKNTDVNAFALAGSNKLYYRLRQQDKDGKETLSAIATVTKTDNVLGKVEVFPNPFNSEVNVSLISAEEGSYTIELSDMQGRVISAESYRVQKGLNNIVLNNLSDLNAGVYFVKLSGAESMTFKLVKTN